MWLSHRCRTFQQHEPLWVELWSGIILMAVAKYMWWTHDLNASPQYQEWLRILTNGEWEAVNFAIGFYQFVAVISGVRVLRWTACALSSWLWFVLGFGLALAPKDTVGVMLYLGLGLANMPSMILLLRFGRARAP